MKRSILITLACLATLVMVANAPAPAAAKSENSTFLIESPHTPEECLAVMDATNKAKELGKWQWGCMSGNHTAYRIVDAKDEAAALAMVPENVRAKAKAYKITKMDSKTLEAAHKQHAN